MSVSRMAVVVASACVVSGAGGCSLLVDGDGYADVSLEAALDSFGDGCAGCLRRSCRYAFEACEKRETCARHAECRSEHPDPSRYWTCGGLDQDFEDLLRCSACTNECRYGSRVECTGRYVWPRPAADVVRWRQRLLDTLEESKAFQGVSVQACSSLSLDCAGSVIAEATTDAQGWYELALPVQDSPAPRAAGFRGIFRLTGEAIPTYQIQVASPIFTDGEDTLRLFERTSLSILGAFGLSLSPGKAHLLFQVFDCMRSGAGGIVIEVGPPNTGSAPLYLQEISRAAFATDTGTRYDGDGIGVVLNLEPEPAVYPLTFREGATGRVYARASVSVAADEFSLIHVQPGPSDEVAPW